jgi:hypothetical protein
LHAAISVLLGFLGTITPELHTACARLFAFPTSGPAILVVVARIGLNRSALAFVIAAGERPLRGPGARIKLRCSTSLRDAGKLALLVPLPGAGDVISTLHAG